MSHLEAAEFMDMPFDFRKTGACDPHLTAVSHFEDFGTLVIEGLFPTNPSKVAFRFKYEQEGGEWKNSGMKLELFKFK